MQLQKINWKLFFKNQSAVEPDDFFRLFNSWIADSPEIFVDVADYQHVHDGPVTLLVGHYADFAIDDSDRRRGLLYSQKRGGEGSHGDQLKSSLTALLKGALRLTSDSVFGGKLFFHTNELKLVVNDRALAPNTKETYQLLKPELESLAATLFGAGSYTLSLDSNPKQRFSVVIQSPKDPGLSPLLSRLEK